MVGSRAVGLSLGLCTGILLFGGVPETLDARMPEPSLGVILTSAPDVTGEARTALINEATRIWERAGVRIEWVLPSAPTPHTIDTLRVLAVRRPAWQTQPRANSVVLGELLRVNESRAIAMVSLGEAMRIVSRLRLEAPGLNDRRIGLVLGRAAAHEIGHYLLDTATHAASGLMRARFNQLEVADPRSPAFDLDEQARGWLQHRLAEELPLGPAAGFQAALQTVPAQTQAPAFAYPR